MTIEGRELHPRVPGVRGPRAPKDQSDAEREPRNRASSWPPRKAAGVVDVEVVAPGVPKAVLKNGFRYAASPAPSSPRSPPTPAPPAAARR